MTTEIEEVVAEYADLKRTRAGVPWVFVRRTRSGLAVFVWREQDRCMSVGSLQALFQLTYQQARTAQLLFGRRTNQEISEILGVSVYTARRHVEAVLLKLNAGSRFEVETILCRTATESLRVSHEGE